ncbi:hypothetical protein BU24DRAFT_414461 [Aaosphaeria arxii CBS 175.79]|uniref:AMP-binding enzyme C-terminal domain-containing protein n=1 Tax=Aaosphaeria arxii CBS 175.79 TaxID=1450172 RepID=A0A6A5XAT9_9PLEO|nr:uncharacterized protein BU24DRAFT_414461 [Aaosphaeria arxii CBS 175.79]KAF2010019.1 hypothetical protein BU24DRAFT_414461 [Aaosphaeria arxii CBS 175.79]
MTTIATSICEQPGENVVREPFVTNGHYDDAEASAGTSHDAPSGSAKSTADAAKEKLVKYKGVHEAPAEVKNHLMVHEDILDAALVGLPGEVPRAYLILRRPAALSKVDAKLCVKFQTRNRENKRRQKKRRNRLCEA